MSGRKSKYIYFIDGKKFSSISAAAKEHGVSTMTIHNWCSGGKKAKDGCYREPKNKTASIGHGDQKVVENQQAIEKVDNSNMTPLEYLLSVMRDENASNSRRITAAISAAQYMHPKGDRNSKALKKEKSEIAARGIYAPARKPSKVVPFDRGKND